MEAKGLICMTHGHELKGQNVGRRGYAGRRGVKGGKWDNCNSIINKYILKKENVLIRSCSQWLSVTGDWEGERGGKGTENKLHK